MEKHTIELANGKRLTDLQMNGNNFISAVSIPDGTLTAENLTQVTIDGEVHSNMLLVDCKQIGTNEYWFILRDRTDQELRDMEINSKIEYLAMIQGVEV